MLPEEELDAPTPAVAVEETPVFWGYSDIFLICGLLFAAVVLMGLAILGLDHVFPKLTNDQTGLALAAQMVFYAAVYFIFRIVFTLRYSKPVFSSLGWVKSKVPLKWCVVGGVVLTAFVQGLLVALRTPKIHSPLEDLLHSTVGLVVVGLMAVTVAPLFEEMIFRGFLQPLLIKTLGLIPGIVIPAAFFGVLHIFQYSNTWQAAAAIFVVGLALGIVRHRGESIVPSTVMHCSYNGVLVAGLIISKFHPIQ